MLIVNEDDLLIEDYSLKICSLKFQLNKDQQKPIIIFLHDSLGCIKLWRDFPKKLVELTEYDALVYDRQGYGQSSAFKKVERDINYLEKEADLLAEILNKMNIQQAILFGHSDGGSIALLTAAKYPDKIKAVITEGAHVFVEDITLEGIKKAEDLFLNTNLKEKLFKYHGDKTEAIFRAWTETWLAESFRNWNIEKYLKQIKCPVLVIQGQKDEYGTQAQVDSIKNQVTGKVETFIPLAVGHSPHKEITDEVLKIAERFIRFLADP